MDLVTKKLVVVSCIVLAIVGVGWAVANPGQRFGISQFGLTTYSRVPVPLFDVQVRGDGAVRWVWKTHDIDAKRVGWLLEPKPEVLIVALGWRSAGRAAENLNAPPETRIVALPTDQALALYNHLKQQGVRVAIHVHSTC